MENPRRAIGRRAIDQHGLVTRSDLADLGVSAGQRRTLVTDGTLELLAVRTYAIAGAPRSSRQRLMAACLDTGGRATLGAASWLHGISGFSCGTPPPVLVERQRFDYRSTIAEVHTSTWLPDEDVMRIDGIPTLGVARTLFSLAGAVPSISRERVVNAVDEAVRDGKATDAWLWWLLERVRRRGRNGVSVFESLLAARTDDARTESWLERQFLRVLAEAGLPTLRCQARIAHDGAFLARVDFLDDATMTVIEVSGHRHHSTRQQTAADAQRRNRLILAGYRVLEFTYDQLVKHPDAVVRQVRAALLTRAPVAGLWSRPAS